MQKVIVADGTELDLISHSITQNDDVAEAITLLIAIRTDSTFTKDDVISKLELGIEKILNDNGEEVELPTTFSTVVSADVNEGEYTLGFDEDNNKIVSKMTIATKVLSESGAEGYLDKLKAETIAKMSAICHTSIEQGVDVTLSDKSVEHFSYDETDRENIKEMFDAVVMGATAYPYHADDESCKTYSAQDIITIYSAMAQNKTHHTTYFNQLKMCIKNMTKITSVSSVTYGQALKGQYLENYNTMMAEAEAQLKKIIENIGK